MQPFTACPIFDSHTHVFPDNIGPRVVAQLGAAIPEPPSYDGTRAGLLRKQAQAGICGCLNAPVATRVDQVTTINTWAAGLNRWPMLSLGAMHPDFPDIRTELQRVKSLGLPGVKLHPEFQQFSPDESRLDPIWQLCCDLELIVLLHAGNDCFFAPPCRAAPAVIARVVRKWPALRLIAAHFGGFQLWDEVERDLIGLPVYLDTSFAIGHLPDEQFVRMARRHGMNRILFASDGPWQDSTAALTAFQRLPLTPAEQEAILWKSAASLFGLSEFELQARSPTACA